MTTTHTSATAGGTQCELILAALQVEGWVDMPTLALVSGSYNVHSRISDLRKAGHNISQRQTRRGRTICSEYRLEKV
jgi:hypothetical protein